MLIAKLHLPRLLFSLVHRSSFFISRGGAHPLNLSERSSTDFFALLKNNRQAGVVRMQQPRNPIASGENQLLSVVALISSARPRKEKTVDIFSFGCFIMKSAAAY